MTAWTAELDTTGLLCPLPVHKARKRLGPLAAGEVLQPGDVLERP